MSQDLFSEQVREENIGAVLEPTCIVCSQNDHSLNNLAVGSYEVILAVRNDGGEQFALHHFFEVLSLEGGLPAIVAPSEIELLAIPPQMTGDVSFQYILESPAQYVLKQIEICIEMENVDTGVISLTRSCVRPDQNVIGLNAVAQGDYQLTLLARAAYPPHFVFEKSRKMVSVRIHSASSFTPSYEWAKVHAWESIPTGLEVR